MAELEALRKLAVAYAKQNNITEYSHALADLQEFVAWGMTNKGFQQSIISQVSQGASFGATAGGS